MLEWIGLPNEAVWWIVIVSVAVFVLALIAVPLLVIRVPADYPRKRPWFRWIWLILKNVLGSGFVFLGVVMLVLPGQGILTILIGITLLDFPGKFKLQRWVVSRRGVLDSINWVRSRSGKEPLVYCTRRTPAARYYWSVVGLLTGTGVMPASSPMTLISSVPVGMTIFALSRSAFSVASSFRST